VQAVKTATYVYALGMRWECVMRRKSLSAWCSRLGHFDKAEMRAVYETALGEGRERKRRRAWGKRRSLR